MRPNPADVFRLRGVFDVPLVDGLATSLSWLRNTCDETKTSTLHLGLVHATPEACRVKPLATNICMWEFQTSDFETAIVCFARQQACGPPRHMTSTK